MATGIITTDLGFTDSGRCIAIQSDNKIIVAGTSNGDFALIRYNVNGTLDSTFGSNGVIKTDFGSVDTANSITVQGDGKIVVAGTTNGDIALARYNQNGTLDVTFGSAGRKITDLGNTETGNGVVVQADGKILVAGSSGYAFAVLRYNLDGSKDTSFGTNGAVLTSGGAELATGIALQPIDQKILLTGDIGPDFGLIRYNTNGTLDTSFSSDGKVQTSVNTVTIDQSNALVVQSDGKILVAGYGYANFALIRYNVDGSLDTSFDTDGIVTTDFGSINAVSHDYGTSLALQSDGKILVAGQAEGRFGLVRYNTDGSRDLSFDLDGMVTTGIGTINTNALNGHIVSVAVQSDQKIVLAGGAQGDFALVRYNSDGSLDPTFGNHAPTASNTTILTSKDLAVNGTLPISLDVDGDNIIYTAAANPSHGILSVQSNGIYLYTPTANYYGSDSFTYSVSDTYGGSNSYTVDVEIAPFVSASTTNETLTGSTSQDDTLSYESATAAVKVSLAITTAQKTGGSGADTISGFENLNGSNFNDTLTGDNGNNILDGGLGADKMAGGLGDDTYIVDDLKDKVAEKAGQGTDTIQTSLTPYSIAKLSAVENLTYTGSGNATLTGNKIDNILTGSTGNDTLDGGLGNDILIGGAGQDTFKFTSKLNATTNIDTITDFTHTEDTIQLSKKIFKAISKSFTADNFLVVGDHTADTNDYIIYDQTSGKLYYDADGSNTKVQAVQIALIGTTDHPELTFSDFLVA